MSSSDYISNNKAAMQLDNELLTIYPNPTNGYINLAGKKAIASWEITNQFGNIYKQGNVNAEGTNKVEIDISAFPTGIYFVKTTFKDGELVMKSVIKE